MTTHIGYLTEQLCDDKAGKIINVLNVLFAILTSLNETDGVHEGSLVKLCLLGICHKSPTHALFSAGLKMHDRMQKSTHIRLVDWLAGSS